jgi:hypothetical protein
MNLSTEICTKTGELTDNPCWLELSLTDGLYYHELPAGHESQGGFPFTKEASKSPNKLEWGYTCSSNTIWASFDCGVVIAYTKEEARELALSELKNTFLKANELLSPAGLSVSFDEDNVGVYKMGTVFIGI